MNTLKTSISLMVTTILLMTCSKSNDPTSQAAGLPTITTSTVTSITGTSAIAGGAISNQGDDLVSARGVCYGTAHNPTIADMATSDGVSTGAFQSELQNLVANTQYYVRAYAVNSKGTAYGDEVSFTTESLIETAFVTNVRLTSVTSGGNITNDGGATITSKGVCFSTSPNPTITDLKTSDGSGSANFVSNPTGLTAGATYHLRAYTTYAGVTSYGSEVVFITAPGLGDTYQGGIVLYLLQPGDAGYSSSTIHGLVVSAQDIVPTAGNYNWGPKVTTGATGLSIGTGASNTQLIANAGAAANSVAKICYDLNLNGYSDWYLPSRYELLAILTNKNSNGSAANITSQIYWSSSEFSNVAADCVWATTLVVNMGVPKDATSYAGVRAIRAF